MDSTPQISRILHAGYTITEGAMSIAFDPIFETPFSRNCHPFPKIEFNHEKIRALKLDAVFISHFHDDHCSLESLNYLDRSTPIYMYCLFEELFDWIRELGFKNVHPLKLNKPVKIGTIEVIPRRALDADIDSLFQIKTKDFNILNVVDSWIDDETLELLKNEGPWDMAMWPFQTMRELEVIAPSRAEPTPSTLPEEWIAQLKVLNPKYVVPSSCQFVQEPWSWYNNAFFPVTYKQFQREIEAALPNSKVVRINPGVSFNLSKNEITKAAPLNWITPIGDQNVDYDYNPNLIPPPTSEVAKHFAALTDYQTAKALEYLRAGLVEKYNSLEIPEDSYFDKPRTWRLSTYDHTGHATHHHYRVLTNHIALVQSNEDPDWSTELPLTKLHSALTTGESLTSMYVRINNAKFEDITEDPLIRCLFTGAFGSYQKAQLERILGR
jgi:L-ascorbate metabolism protein UlaG (beta-lactamase superfamily)